ncbi:MAG: hypothetical protein ABFS35_23850, partial [Bacteroidota bacterium]
MAKLKNIFIAIIIILITISCNHQKTDVEKTQRGLEQDADSVEPPKVIPVNINSISRVTPGKNGVPSPIVVKLNRPKIHQVSNLPIIPGVSYLPQTEKEKSSGKKPVKSKKPKTIKVDKNQLPVYKVGEQGTIRPIVYTIEKPNSPKLIENSYTIQYRDTIYPPVVKRYPTPQSKTALAPDYRDNVTGNIKYLGQKEGLS